MSSSFNLHDRLGYKLTLAAQVNNQIFVGLLEEINLTRQMWCVLIAVGEQNIHQPSDIADYIGIQRAAVSRTLKDMQKKGMLERHNDPDNGKRTLVELTPLGTELLAKSLQTTQISSQRLEQKLSANERQELDRLLTKFLSGPAPTPSRI